MAISDHTPSVLFDLGTTSPFSTAQGWSVEAGTIDPFRRVRSFSFNRGRDNEFGSYQAGKLSLLLDNLDDRYLVGSTAASGGVEVSARGRFRLGWDSTVFPAFDGYITKIDPEWPAGGNDAIVRIELEDGLRYLNGRRITADYSTAALSGARIGQILTNAGWPNDVSFRSLDSGQSQLKEVSYQRQSALAMLDHCARTEYGRFFISNDGKATFHDRNRVQQSGQPLVVFGDSSGAIGPPVFAGSGLNDFTSTGSFTGAPTETFTATVVSTTGAADLYDWAISGSTVGATGVAMSTTPALLAQGVYAKWNAKTGHATGSVWSWPAGEVKIDANSNLKASRAVEDIINRALISIAGATGEIIAGSSTSQAAHNVQDFTRSQTLHVNTGEAEDLANFLVLRYATPITRFSRIPVKGQYHPATWSKILALELGDPVRSNRRTEAGNLLSQDCIIEQIQGAGTPDIRSWSWVFGVSPADPTEYITLDHPVRGRIESTGTTTGFSLGY